LHLASLHVVARHKREEEAKAKRAGSTIPPENRTRTQHEETTAVWHVKKTTTGLVDRMKRAT
jgi:hypothetical protein